MPPQSLAQFPPPPHGAVNPCPNNNGRNDNRSNGWRRGRGCVFSLPRAPNAPDHAVIIGTISISCFVARVLIDY